MIGIVEIANCMIFGFENHYPRIQAHLSAAVYR
jgi:hypothetical protein